MNHASEVMYGMSNVAKFDNHVFVFNAYTFTFENFTFALYNIRVFVHIQ